MAKTNQKISLFGKIIRIIIIIVLSPVLIVRAIFLSVKNRKNHKIFLQKVQISTISQTDLLTGVEFEQFLSQIFKAMGYDVSLTKSSSDFGADLIAVKNKTKIAVQAKRYSKTVGAHAVQEVLGAKKHYGATEAMVITNNYFSKEAQTLALENDIKLIDRTSLINLIGKIKVEIIREKCNLCALTSASVTEIEGRYSHWI